MNHAKTQALGVVPSGSGARRLWPLSLRRLRARFFRWLSRPSYRGSRRRPWRRSSVILVLVALATFGGGVGLLWSGWHSVYGATPAIESHQDILEDAWEAGTGSTQELIGSLVAGALAGATDQPIEPLPGSAVARMWAPSLGQRWIVVQGTEPWDIENAPGHYENSVLPGQRGNFAVAGHRTPAIFWDLDRLKAGDKIVVETRKGFHIYVVTTVKITHPQSWAEVNPTPPGFKYGSKVLTLTTCNPKWDNYERLVVHARYDKMVKEWSPPPAG